MTEYDFSPEAHRRFMDTMNHVSSWVGETEQYRSQFGDAAALTTPTSRESSRTKRSPSRRPPPLDLNKSGPSYSYPTPPHSASSFEEFAYAEGPGSPGPMPGSMFRPSPPRAYDPTWRASPPHPHLPYSPSSMSPGFSHGPGSPTYYMPPPTPYVPYPPVTPGYFITIPSRKSRRGRSSGHRSTTSSTRIVSCSYVLLLHSSLPAF